jgi:hypothetical protein
VDKLKRREGAVGNLLSYVIDEIVAVHILQEDPNYYPWFGPGLTVQGRDHGSVVRGQ